MKMELVSAPYMEYSIPRSFLYYNDAISFTHLDMHYYADVISFTMQSFVKKRTLSWGLLVMLCFLNSCTMKSVLCSAWDVVTDVFTDSAEIMISRVAIDWNNQPHPIIKSLSFYTFSFFLLPLLNYDFVRRQFSF